MSDAAEITACILLLGIRKRVRYLSAKANCDDNFKESLISLITLASNADALFAGSNNEEKRKILNCVFSNLMLKGATLCYELRKPFDMMVACDDFAKWLRLVDSIRTSTELRLIIQEVPLSRNVI